MIWSTEDNSIAILWREEPMTGSKFQEAKNRISSTQTKLTMLHNQRVVSLEIATINKSSLASTTSFGPRATLQDKPIKQLMDHLVRWRVLSKQETFKVWV